MLNVDAVPCSAEASSKEAFPQCRHFLQSPFWAHFKSHHGWKPHQFLLTVKDAQYIPDCSVYVSVLVRTFARCLSIAYVPMGIDCVPAVLDENSAAEYTLLLRQFSLAIKKYLPRTLFIRFDPPASYSDSFSKTELKSACKKSSVKKAFSDIQPPDTVLLDITQSEDDLLSQMKPKWRYNIRLAEKKGVTVTKRAEDAIDVFYQLYEETSKRDGIALHQKSYYQDLFACAGAENRSNADSVSPVVSLYVAEYENEPIAAIITLFTAYEAVYLYGASSNQNRNVMPAYLLQWQAIQDAKKFGSKVYDFYGIPPTDDEHHPMHGLYRFKTGFGGAVVHRIGSIDVSLSVLYPLYMCAEKLRLFWFKKVKKILAKGVRK